MPFFYEGSPNVWVKIGSLDHPDDWPMIKGAPWGHSATEKGGPVQPLQAEPDRPLGSVLPGTYSLAGEIHDPETHEELAALKASVSDLIEATVQSVNTRPRRGRKRV